MTLKFTALFSSIAGRFGNVGQSDYAAANEMLNKLAHWLDRRWPGRVVSLDLGPLVGRGDGFPAREPPRQPGPGHDLARGGRLAAGRMSCAMAAKGTSR